ncbi:hypothetical protein PS9374_07019 [Planomonospora sphaerica]|uniref:Uncharacterized protein n=1 Tax=Planomonospora sphaerica TaxID=161355 RepID=A0A171DQI6_9ACTN|nr:hypothetical protein PS9374_07019 [Planomonospora sphaerica]
MAQNPTGVMSASLVRPSRLATLTAVEGVAASRVIPYSRRWARGPRIHARTSRATQTVSRT